MPNPTLPLERLLRGLSFGRSNGAVQAEERPHSTPQQLAHRKHRRTKAAMTKASRRANR